MVRHFALLLLTFLSLVASALPFLALAERDFREFELLVAVLNFIGWLSASFLFFSKRRFALRLEDTVKAIGFPLAGDDLQENFESFLLNSRRYHTAAYGFRTESNVTSQNLSASLRRVTELAFELLPVNSVQLCLSDEVTGLATQSMILGVPIVAASQDSGEPAPGEDNEAPVVINGERAVMKANVVFAGHTFGTLWVEFRSGYTPTRSDRQVLHLLATQGALMLVDARFTDELLRMRRAGEESIRAKTGFLANLSHEIRGPLGIILNAVELILDGLCGPVTEMQRDMLLMIKTNGDHLLDLVNDVLDYAKIEAGKVSAKPVEIRLRELAEDLASVVRSQALAKKHKLILEEIDVTLGVLCDKRHARQMLLNFLTNAVKYTPEGGRITMKAERIAGNRVKISVSDTGVGIPADQRHKVFSAFERVDNNITRSQVGTGLGMPLTQRLAEVNGGSVDFESQEGRGSTFWIVLPAVTLEDRPPEQTSSEGSGKALPQGQGETVLLVDHDPQTREMLARYLGHQGFQLLEATSSHDVMRFLRSQSIAVAVIENDMPDLSGEDIVTIIRGYPRTASVPIILLSTRAFVFDIERFLRLGVDRCLSKPIDLSELAHTIRRLVDETRANAEPEPSSPG